MAVVTLIAECIGCGVTFSANPHKVPTVHVRRRRASDGPGAGVDLIQDDAAKEPLCRNCFERANVVRRACGLAVWIIDDDAYEPYDEESDLP
jgi:Fe-S-cluster-containing dehydrogenase component